MIACTARQPMPRAYHTPGKHMRHRTWADSSMVIWRVHLSDLNTAFFTCGTKQALEGFSDSDWAVKHSTSGHTFSLGSATISWASKKQPSVALSSCEAEIMASSEAAKEAIYLSAFLRELGFDMSEPPPLKMDNKSAIDLANNPEHHARTKHIDRRHYFIRECVENGRLRVPFVATADNIADFFTKPLMGKDFFRLRDKVMNAALAPSRGRSQRSHPG